MMNLEGKVACITGGSYGIRLTLAPALAEAGVTIDGGWSAYSFL